MDDLTLLILFQKVLLFCFLTLPSFISLSLSSFVLWLNLNSAFENCRDRSGERHVGRAQAVVWEQGLQEVLQGRVPVRPEQVHGLREPLWRPEPLGLRDSLGGCQQGERVE